MRIAMLPKQIHFPLLRERERERERETERDRERQRERETLETRWNLTEYYT